MALAVARESFTLAIISHCCLDLFFTKFPEKLDYDPSVFFASQLSTFKV